MKLVGRISDWNDEKGFGFVIPHGGGTRAFVHVRSFQPGSRRPVNGDLISYQPTLDSRGRTNARNIVLAGQRVVEPKHERKQKRRRPLPRLALALVFAVSVVAGVVAGHVPVVLLFAYAAASVLSYVMYCLDKAAAGKKGRQRTPESTLHLVDFLGGWPGALIAQHEFRHKTVKASFQSFFWFTVLANIGLNAWLVHSGTAQVLAEMLSR
ncbi:MAG: cold shock and DUF1294 domain-containing protein [Pseudomonadota bacterium]|nr:cold shock and DUF1294 domain-containing protein [Pseudomonadota bacterium]